MLTFLTGYQRWPRFVPRAREAGITAVAAVMLHTPHLPLGAANLLMSTPPYLSARDLRLARVLASTTSSAFAQQHELRSREKVVSQLRTALESRLVIEQAKGILAERFDVEVDQAFTRLRGHARSHQQHLTELATQIARGNPPAALDRSP
ncbi:ANTAR domain-containing protein [Streptomyces sp. ODS28]|uniref:ANTAR domain-containing protein n=1 Tax=Streptomyces sp. ODS28 TaxID=3136688 RepID=UPI0031E8E0E1